MISSQYKQGVKTAWASHPGGGFTYQGAGPDTSGTSYQVMVWTSVRLFMVRSLLIAVHRES